MEIFVFNWWRMNHQPSTHKGLRLFGFCVVSWYDFREPPIERCMGPKSGVAQIISGIQKLWQNWRWADGFRVEYFPGFNTLQLSDEVKSLLLKLQRLEWLKSSPEYRNFDRIDGEPMDFEWNSTRCSSVTKSKVYCWNYKDWSGSNHLRNTETLTELTVSRWISSGIFSRIQHVAAQGRSQKFIVEIRRYTREFHRKNRIHVDFQRHFLWIKRDRRRMHVECQTRFSICKEIWKRTVVIHWSWFSKEKVLYQWR